MLVGLPVELGQRFPHHVELRLAVALEHLRIALPQHLRHEMIRHACPLRIDMLSDSTRDRCPSEASAHWRSTLGSSETIRSDNRSALTSSNSEWFRRKCPPADVRRLPQGAPVFGESGSYWGVIEASAVALPSIGMEPGDWSWYRRDWIRRSPFQSSVRAIRIEICPEIEQLVLQVRRRPEQSAIQILASNRADQPFHKGMGQGNIGDGFDFGHFQDPQIGLPLPKPIQGIMVGAEVVGHTGLPSNGAVEHAAKCHAIDSSGVDAEPNDVKGGEKLGQRGGGKIDHSR